MNNDILNLEPKAIWKNFSALNSVPRPSKKEEKVINIQTKKDDCGKSIYDLEILNKVLDEQGMH